MIEPVAVGDALSLVTTLLLGAVGLIVKQLLTDTRALTEKVGALGIEQARHDERLNALEPVAKG